MTGIDEKKETARGWYGRARQLMLAKEYGRAIEAYSKAIEQDREFGAAYFCRGACQYMLGRYKTAVADMDAAALLGHRDAQLWSRYELPARDSGDD